ncbi:MAG TPA: hypothetical protein DCQ04_15325 [Actinobacteria bacterium]|nr:hypothetical protein [Actinomycetota bacterium]
MCLTDTSVSGRPLRVRRGTDMLRLECDLPDGSSGLIALATIKDGLPTGQFAMDPAILVYGGTVMNVLDQLPLRAWAHPPRDALLCSQGAGPTRGVYHVTSPDSPSVDVIVDQVRSTWIPLLLAYSGQWNDALDHTLAHPQEVAAPLSTATILAFLAHRSDRMNEITSTAQRTPQFWDAREIPDIDEHIHRIEALVASCK